MAGLTAAALGGDFGYARGPVPFSDSDLAPDASWVEIARPLAGFRTLLTEQVRVTDLLAAQA